MWALEPKDKSKTNNYKIGRIILLIAKKLHSGFVYVCFIKFTNIPRKFGHVNPICVGKSNGINCVSRSKRSRIYGEWSHIIASSPNPFPELINRIHYLNRTSTEVFFSLAANRMWPAIQKDERSWFAFGWKNESETIFRIKHFSFYLLHPRNMCKWQWNRPSKWQWLRPRRKKLWSLEVMETHMTTASREHCFLLFFTHFLNVTTRIRIPMTSAVTDEHENITSIR